MARRVHRAKSFSYDLLADWRPYADAPPPAVTDSDWLYHGTVTLDGETGALAWKRGWFGIAVGSYPVRELGMWESIQIDQEVRERVVTGWEMAPTFPETHPTPTDPINGWAKAPPDLRREWENRGK